MWSTIQMDGIMITLWAACGVLYSLSLKVLYLDLFGKQIDSDDDDDSDDGYFDALQGGKYNVTRMRSGGKQVDFCGLL